jgi:SAM-dependent methyltransferase
MTGSVRESTSTTLAVCWCGNQDLTTFGQNYLECACGTLVRSTMPLKDVTRVEDEEHDLYGRNYWFAHQRALGLPDLQERSVADLRGRCLQWLRTVLAYKAPPGRVVEIGAAHGVFVALLAAAGFDATGIELSPWVVDYARRTSGARMLLGPLEDQQLDPRSCDLIVALDVLEHLPDPVGTMTRCAELLRDDGLLVLQTPRRQAGVDFIQASSGRFRDMLIPEHLYLFSETSARQLLQRVGLSAVSMEQPIFDTDMVLVAGRRPFGRVSETHVPDRRAGSGARGRSSRPCCRSMRTAASDRRASKRDTVMPIATVWSGCEESASSTPFYASRSRPDGGSAGSPSWTLLRHQQADQDHRATAPDRTARTRGLPRKALQSLRALMADHRDSRVYRAMVRLRWRAFDSAVWPLVGSRAPWRSGPDQTSSSTRDVPCGVESPGDGMVAVDSPRFTEVRTAVQSWRPSWSPSTRGSQRVLLTSATSHHEVAALDAPNVRRRTVNPSPTALSELLDEEKLSVLFCPMSASPFDDPRVQVVCLINDLQYLSHPEFFDDEERQARRAAFHRAVRAADHVITPSAYVRGTILQHSNLSDAQVTVISHGFSGYRLPQASEQDISETLQRHDLLRGRYFIYPANFWPHKNHLMLLVAFAQLCQRRPDLDLSLVLTGATRPDPGIVRESAVRMRLADRVKLPGYVPDTELSALLAGALALVFPPSTKASESPSTRRSPPDAPWPAAASPVCRRSAARRRSTSTPESRMRSPTRSSVSRQARSSSTISGSGDGSRFGNGTFPKRSPAPISTCSRG